MTDPFVEVGERLAVVEVRRMNDVSGRAEPVGEREAPRRHPCA